MMLCRCRCRSLLLLVLLLVLASGLDGGALAKPQSDSDPPPSSLSHLIHSRAHIDAAEQLAAAKEQEQAASKKKAELEAEEKQIKMELDVWEGRLRDVEKKLQDLTVQEDKIHSSLSFKQNNEEVLRQPLLPSQIRAVEQEITDAEINQRLEQIEGNSAGDAKKEVMKLKMKLLSLQSQQVKDMARSHEVQELKKELEPFKKQRRELDNEHFAALNKVAELRQSLLFATSALKSASVQHEYAVSRLEKAVIELHSFDVK